MNPATDVGGVTVWPTHGPGVTSVTTLSDHALIRGQMDGLSRRAVCNQQMQQRRNVEREDLFVNGVNHADRPPAVTDQKRSFVVLLARNVHGVRRNPKKKV